MKTRLFHRPLAVAGFLLVVFALLLAAPHPAVAQPNVDGQWSTLPYTTPVNPVHVSLMHDGKVLVIGGTQNAVWDPTSGTFTPLTTSLDLLGAGIAFLPDGRAILMGGTQGVGGASSTVIFDPTTQSFTQAENMNAGRLSPTAIALSDGGTMVFGGLDGQGAPNGSVEIYDVGAGYAGPYPAPFTPSVAPRLHVLANGSVFMSGPDPSSRTFEPTQATWSNASSSTLFGNNRRYGSSVVLPLDPDRGYSAKIMLFGGNDQTGTDTVELIDLGTWPEVWVSAPSMSVPRTNMNAVLLPNGKILAVGGSTFYNDPATSHRNAETYDPATQTWTPSGTAAFDRLAGSTALLLPDATVWVAGTTTAGGFEQNMEIYQPPYLFTAGGTLATRPTITSAPDNVDYGQSFTVETPNAGSIGKVVLMRPGSNTQSFDAEARLVYAYFSQDATSLTVFAPTSQGAAPPGWYMLFLFDNAGVPSVAKFIRLGAAPPPNQAPTATITSPAGAVTISAGQSVTFAGTASDPDGTIAGYAWTFGGGSPAGSAAQNPGAVTFAAAGVYTVSLTATDNLGATSAAATVTVTVNPALGVSITSPANAAMVSGSVMVSMTATGGTGAGYTYTVKAGTATIYNGAANSFSWNTAALSNGSVTLVASVTDAGGGTASTSKSVTISNQVMTPPAPQPQPITAAQIQAAQQYALQTWPNYKTWDSLPQYLKDAALEAAPASPQSAAPAVSTGAVSAGQLQSAQQYAAQNWPNYKSWDSLPQYLKDAALDAAGSAGVSAPAPSSSGAPSGGNLDAAIAYAAQNWPNYKSWDSLPQYLKDAALGAAGGGGAAMPATPSSGGASGGNLQAAMTYAAQTWPNYKSWESLPQYLKDAALNAVM